MELIEAIKTRRSIRRYKSTMMKDEDIEAVLRLLAGHLLGQIHNAGSS